MSEGGMPTGLSGVPVWLESLDRLFAKRTPRPKVGPERADEGGGPDAGRLEKRSRYFNIERISLAVSASAPFGSSSTYF